MLDRLSEVVLELRIDIFPGDAFEEIADCRVVGEHAFLHQVGDGGIPEVSLPVGTVIVRHDRRRIGFVLDLVGRVTARRIDLRTRTFRPHASVRDSAERLIDLYIRRELPLHARRTSGVSRRAFPRTDAPRYPTRRSSASRLRRSR